MASRGRSPAITPLTPVIGAEIAGVDLGRVSNHDAEAIHAALLEHKVLFFRDQRLSPEQHKAVGRLFGELIVVPFVAPMAGHPEIIEIVKEADERGIYNFGGNWHTDLTYLETPAKISVLYGVDIPAVGGDTLFASLPDAFEALSSGLQRLLMGLTGVHTASRSYGTRGKFAQGTIADGGMDVRPSVDADREVEHPVVRTHPETGRRCLYVNPNFTFRFKDMTEAESKPLLDFLFAHMTRDEFTCRFRWTPGAVAIWDNRQTMHRAMNDYDGHRRVTRRVTVGGDRPKP
jgi:taurine dioxygenase